MLSVVVRRPRSQSCGLDWRRCSWRLGLDRRRCLASYLASGYGTGLASGLALGFVMA